MRILLLSHVPDDPDGGASRVYHLLADELSKRGHEVTLKHLDDLRLPKSRLVTLAVRRLVLPSAMSLSARRWEPESYDVVMASSGTAAPLFRRLLKQRRRPVMVHHLHGSAGADHAANMAEAHRRLVPVSLAYRLVTGPLTVVWDRAGYRSADVTVVQNLRDLDEARAFGGGPHVELIAPAVHPAILAARPAEGVSRAAGQILWFASWEARKGAHLLPAAFRQVREGHPEASLVIGGTGKSPLEILRDFDTRDHERITILPRISVDEHLELLWRSSIFVFPSLSEGFGLALPEAMSCGVAAVTTDTAFGGDYLTDEVDARVVPPSSSHLARALTWLLDDDERRAAVAGRGQELARQFTLRRMADGYEDLFRRLLDQRESRYVDDRPST